MGEPFNTKTLIGASGMATYRIIAGRLAALQPPILIDGHIAQREEFDQKTGAKAQFSTLAAHDSTLDGINFIAKDPKTLAKAFDNAKDKWGYPALTSMKEDPGHWALKASFGKTIGTGWREVWREAPYSSAAAVLPTPGKPDSKMSMRFGTAGNPIRFTALHCAVHEIGGQCNVHIDESGFVLALPKGVALTPDFYDHIMNELKWKTDFRDWLSGMVDDAEGKRIIEEVIRRVSITFINSTNGYAGLEQTINSMKIRGPLDVARTAFRIVGPIGVSIDLVEREAFKVQVTGSRVNGDTSVTLSIGGQW